MIQRYIADKYGELTEWDDGDAVKYEDHLSEVAALRKKLAAIEDDTFTKCLAICEEERLADPRMKEEKAYEQAIDNCVRTIQQSKDSAQGEK